MPEREHINIDSDNPDIVRARLIGIADSDAAKAEGVYVHNGSEERIIVFHDQVIEAAVAALMKIRARRAST